MSGFAVSGLLVVFGFALLSIGLWNALAYSPFRPVESVDRLLAARRDWALAWLGVVAALLGAVLWAQGV